MLERKWYLMTESYIAKNNRWKNLVNGYLGTAFNQRMPLKQFLHSAGIRRDVYDRLKADYNIETRKEQLEGIRRIQEGVFGEVKGPEQEEGINLSPQEWLDEHFLEVVKYTFESAKKGNAQSQKLFAQLAGKLVEKSEVKVGLTADDYYRIREEAKRRAGGDNGEADRDRSLLAESAVLPEEVRQDTGRE